MAFLYAEKLAQLAESCKTPVTLFRDKAVICVCPGQCEYMLRSSKNKSQRTADSEDGWILRIGDN